MTTNLATLAAAIFADNVAVGWWTDPETGASIVKTRNRPMTLMLTVSELSEASTGHRANLQDDHLPQYKMVHVELADAAIRLLDLAGAEEIDWSKTVSLIDRAVLLTYGVPFRENLMDIVDWISLTMEHHRKGRVDKYHESLHLSIQAIIALAERIGGPDLFEVIEAKREYNRNRLDHKLQSRKAEDGKAY